MKKQKENKQKGITLIALIITIIVMLILVGVSVSVALNGGLFKAAKQASKQTNRATEKERLFSAVIGAIGEDGKVDFSKLDSNLSDDFTNDKGKYISENGNEFIVRENGYIIDSDEYVLETKYGLKIGDKINYQPNTETITPTGIKPVTTAQMTTEDLGQWRVLGVNDNGQIELISEETTEDSFLTIENAESYLDAVNILNNICNELYGTGNGADSARSLTVEDINELGDGISKTVSKGWIKWADAYSVNDVTPAGIWTSASLTGDWTYKGSYFQTYLGKDFSISSANPGPLEYKYEYYENINLRSLEEVALPDGGNMESLLSTGLDSGYTSGPLEKNIWLASMDVQQNIGAPYDSVSNTGGDMYSIYLIRPNGNIILDGYGCGVGQTDWSFGVYYGSIRPVVTLSSDVVISSPTDGDIYTIESN